MSVHGLVSVSFQGNLMYYFRLDLFVKIIIFFKRKRKEETKMILFSRFALLTVWKMDFLNSSSQGLAQLRDETLNSFACDRLDCPHVICDCC